PVKDSTHQSVSTVRAAPRQSVGRKSSIRRMVFRGQRTATIPAPYSSTTRRMFFQGVKAGISICTALVSSAKRPSSSQAAGFAKPPVTARPSSSRAPVQSGARKNTQAMLTKRKVSPHRRTKGSRSR
ncbi:Manganese transport regulator, partial [Dysosmobacter welbionis]